MEFYRLIIVEPLSIFLTLFGDLCPSTPDELLFVIVNIEANSGISYCILPYFVIFGC